MRYITALLLSLFITTAYAGWDTWDTDTKTMFVASQLAIAADWATTRDGVRNGFARNTHETNSILGRYPHKDRVDAYMLTLMISNYYITDWVPQQYRGWYLGLRTATHAVAARNNLELGWRMRF